MIKLSIIKYRSAPILLLLLFTICNVLAHTDNETTLFPDIQSTDARFDIMLLVGMGIIPVTENFHPENRLTRLDLAAWGTLAAGLETVGDTVDIQALAESALHNGMVETVDGNASYSDVNDVLFKGLLIPATPLTIPTRAEAARYIAANLISGDEGEILLDRQQMHFGPTGEVTKIESRMNPDGGTSYFVTIAGETYPVYSHGKLANGPTDLKLWHDKIVRRSVIRNLGQLKVWVYLEADDESHTDHQHTE